MKHLILHLGQLNTGLDTASFSSYNLESLRKQDVLKPIEECLKGIDEKDLFPYRVSSHITSEKHESIIIIKEGLRWDEVIRLAVYFRLLPDEKWISNAPIIICTDNMPNPINDRDLGNIRDIQNYLHIPGVFYESFDNLFKKRENDEGNLDYKINSFLKSINKDFDTKSITVTSENLAHDRHSITNYWGAVKLALNAGYGIEDIKYTFPPTLYFNYLIKKYGLKSSPNDDKLNLSSLLNKNKILLVDDNSDKGWKAVMEKIFEPANIDVAEDFEKVNQLGNLNIYDLILLDLRLPKSQKNNIDYDHGINLLKIIKESFPQVPVIVFTASNKSWTRESVLNYGADGMYVKESPEYAGDKNYSKKNFENFTKLVIDTLEKYKVLRPYWESIQNIKNNETFKSIPEKRNGKCQTNFKSRIEERLMMFYGLLKRGFEQTEFNEKQFHFSDYELAFMTLWSILNEISEANYQKTQPKNVSVIDGSGKLLTRHPSGKPISYLTNHYKWEIINQSDVFVEYIYNLDFDKNTGFPSKINSGKDYKLNHEQISSFVFEKSSFQIKPAPEKTKTNYETTLYLQIAFLIEKKNNLASSSNKSVFQKTLVRLNEVRNHLYLTHGSDISTGFYNQTEKAKRDDHTIKPNEDIKDLFELISFLLTGKEIKVDIK